MLLSLSRASLHQPITFERYYILVAKAAQQSVKLLIQGVVELSEALLHLLCILCLLHRHVRVVRTLVLQGHGEVTSALRYTFKSILRFVYPACFPIDPFAVFNVRLSGIRRLHHYAEYVNSPTRTFVSRKHRQAVVTDSLMAAFHRYVGSRSLPMGLQWSRSLPIGEDSYRNNTTAAHFLSA